VSVKFVAKLAVQLGFKHGLSLVGEETGRQNNIAVVYPCGEPPISSDSFAPPTDDLETLAVFLLQSTKALPINLFR
jgi:hypothetical protein